MLKQLSLKSMVQYEKLTKNNAFALFQKTEKSATDLRDIVYMLKYNLDNTVTMESIENLSVDEFQSVLLSLNTDA